MIHPPFCPNPKCSHHLTKRIRSTAWFRTAGNYSTKAFGKVRRFQCVDCKKYFSEQTFSIDYFAKKQFSYHRLLEHLYTTSSIRDIARSFQVKPDTVLNKLSRLARNATVLLSRVNTSFASSEHLVADGFESFCVSQYFPNNFNLLAGKDSQYLYWFDYVTLRRKGRMTDEQRERREELEKQFKADPKGIRKSFDYLLDVVAHTVCDSSSLSTDLYTDEHGTYKAAVKSDMILKCLKEQKRFKHVRVSSKAPRTTSNPLFAVNYLDRQIRKDMAEHVRETVCFARNVNRSMDRMVLYLTYHNFKKPFREQAGKMHSHAEEAGIATAELKKLSAGFYINRWFQTRDRLEGTLKKVWFREFETPLKKTKEYIPSYVSP